MIEVIEMANKYQQMKIQKNIKQEVRLKAFYFLDLALILGLCGGMFYLQDFIQLPIGHFIVIECLLFALGIFLCAKPSSNGGHRNLYTLYCLLKMDRTTYGVQSYKKGAN
ncbi:DUF5592 family protein [Enterococcus sp. S52]|uniref:DUF5592 family protein n=2 Tax=Enterococcus TaxID=1350 RepID=UPI0019039BD2|nr:DUF5592 family protein [Enterococcus sp. S52]